MMPPHADDYLHPTQLVTIRVHERSEIQVPPAPHGVLLCWQVDMSITSFFQRTTAADIKKQVELEASKSAEMAAQARTSTAPC